MPTAGRYSASVTQEICKRPTILKFNLKRVGVLQILIPLIGEEATSVICVNVTTFYSLVCPQSQATPP